MPDLTIEVYYHCQSAQDFVTEIGKYTVAYGPSRGQYQYDYTCTCPAFKFGKGKPCKHIEQAKVKHCNWNQFISGEKPIDKDGEKCCPKCGLPVFAERYGV